MTRSARPPGEVKAKLASRGSASRTARLMARAPWLPPITSRCFTGSLPDLGFTRLKSFLTGLPVTTPRPPSLATVSGKVTATSPTKGASQRLVAPGTRFCSCISVGTRRSTAAASTGPDA